MSFTNLDTNSRGKEVNEFKLGLKRLIVGQNEAIEAIVNVFQTFLVGMNPPGRPAGNFLFLGPTGSGKTRTVEATAKVLMGTENAVTRIDCAEFQHSYEIAKLIGSPPGYLGHRETHPMLSQEKLSEYYKENMKFSFILFDEIEKASDALWSLLLGILDKATLTLGDNRRVDFKNSMIFLTSNLGAKAMSERLRPRLGFASAQAPPPADEKIEKAGVEAARRKFTPEFINRLDKIVVFKSLSLDDLRLILDIEIKMVQERVFSSASRPFVFTVEPEAKNHILADGFNPEYGARHLKRAVERALVQPLSNLISSGQVHEGDWLSVGYNAGENRMFFNQKAEGLSHCTMAEIARSPDTITYEISKSAGAGT
jgi:ATP-dependent Clp protease ATP-binding subunit ClpB